VVAAAAEAKKPPKSPSMPSSIDEISNADIDSWLIADSASPTPDRPSGVYGGDTQTISTYRENTPAKPTQAPAPQAPAPQAPSPPEDVAEHEVDDEEETNDEMETVSDAEATEEFVDESNPFYQPKKKPEVQAKPIAKDSSDAASDILRKIMERRRSR